MEVKFDRRIFIAPFVKIGRSFQNHFRHRSTTYHFRCSRHRGSWYNGITRAYRLNISPISMSSSVSSVENSRRSSRYIIDDVIQIVSNPQKLYRITEYLYHNVKIKRFFIYKYVFEKVISIIFKKNIILYFVFCYIYIYRETFLD